MTSAWPASDIAYPRQRVVVGPDRTRPLERMTIGMLRRPPIHHRLAAAVPLPGPGRKGDETNPDGVLARIAQALTPPHPSLSRKGRGEEG